MDIDTNWCIYCNKQTDGSLYCSSQCRMKDEKQSMNGMSCDDSTMGTCDSCTRYSSSESSSTCSSTSTTNRYINKYLFYRSSNELKFRNRPSFDTGYYGRKSAKSMQQPWLERSEANVFTNYGKSQAGRHRHLMMTSYSSDSSEDGYSTTSTIINTKTNFGGRLIEHNYPWSSSDEDDDDDISLYEY